MAISPGELHRFTFDEFEKMADAGIFHDVRFELLDGLVFEMSRRGDPHWHATSTLNELLADQRAERYVVSASSLTLQLGPRDAREPDLVLSRGSLNDVRRRPRPEDIALLVEVADSSLAYDLGEKKRAYAEAGIAEYWVVSVPHKVVHVFRGANRFDGTYLSEASYEGEAVISPAEYPDVAIPIALLFRFGKS